MVVCRSRIGVCVRTHDHGSEEGKARFRILLVKNFNGLLKSRRAMAFDRRESGQLCLVAMVPDLTVHRFPDSLGQFFQSERFLQEPDRRGKLQSATVHLAFRKP